VSQHTRPCEQQQELSLAWVGELVLPNAADKLLKALSCARGVRKSQASEHTPRLDEADSLQLADRFLASPSGALGCPAGISPLCLMRRRERLAKPPTTAWKQPASSRIDRQQEQLGRERKILCAQAVASDRVELSR